jgi:hypothetical protein
MEFTKQEKTLLKMLLNQQYQFMEFTFSGIPEDKALGLQLVLDIQDKLGE